MLLIVSEHSTFTWGYSFVCPLADIVSLSHCLLPFQINEHLTEKSFLVFLKKVFLLPEKATMKCHTYLSPATVPSKECTKKSLDHLPVLLFHILPFGRLYHCEPGIIKNKNKQWPWPCLGVSMETRPHYKALPTVCDWQTSPAKDVPNKFEGTVETYPAGCELPLLLLISTRVQLHPGLFDMSSDHWRDIKKPNFDVSNIPLCIDSDQLSCLICAFSSCHPRV